MTCPLTVNSPMWRTGSCQRISSSSVNSFDPDLLVVGIPCHISLSSQIGEELRVQVDIPDNDDLSILLHRLRPFILDDEPASFVKVASIIGRRVSTPYVRQLLREQRALYDGRRFLRTIQIASNETILNSDRVLRGWLNSHEYHRDPDKREAIDELFAATPGKLLQGILVNMLVEKVRAIHNVAALVALLLGRQPKLTFTTHARSGEARPSIPPT